MNASISRPLITQIANWGNGHERPLQFWDESGGVLVPLETYFTHPDEHWVRMGAEHHIPERKYDREIGVAERAIDRVVNTMVVGCDRETVQPSGKTELDIGMGRQSGDCYRNKLPVDEACWRAQQQKWQPNHRSTPERVEKVMAGALHNTETYRTVMN